MKVLRLSPLRCPSGAASAPSSPMRIGSPEVFSFEEQDGSVHAPLPWEQSPAAALESLRELEACCQPACEAQLMVRAWWWGPGAIWQCCGRPSSRMAVHGGVRR